MKKEKMNFFVIILCLFFSLSALGSNNLEGSWNFYTVVCKDLPEEDTLSIAAFYSDNIVEFENHISSNSSCVSKYKGNYTIGDGQLIFEINKIPDDSEYRKKELDVFMGYYFIENNDLYLSSPQAKFKCTRGKLFHIFKK